MVTMDKEGKGESDFFCIPDHGFKIGLRRHSCVPSCETSFRFCQLKGDDGVEFLCGPHDPGDDMFNPRIIGHHNDIVRFQYIKDVF
jgi:hypothetical protein